MLTFTEGEDCYVASYTEDFRDVATCIVLKGGEDERGNAIVAIVSDEESAAKYGFRTKTIVENQWTTADQADLRARHLLANYCEPARNITIDCEPEPIEIGDIARFVSASMGIDGVFNVKAAQYDYGVDGDRLLLQLTNRLVSLTDIVDAIQSNLQLIKPYAVLERTHYGKITADNFDDNGLSPAWTYEEGVAGNTIAEQNQRLEFVRQLESYAHVQRTFSPASDPQTTPVLIVRANQVTSDPSYGELETACLALWFNLYDFAAIRLHRSDYGTHKAFYDINGVITQVESGSYALNTWKYLKIIATTGYVYFYWSADGRTWTLITSVARPGSWVIDENSLVIVGHGYEQTTGVMPNPHFNNNNGPWSSATSYFDDFKMVENEIITVKRLETGWYFKVVDGSTVCGTSSGAEGETATLNIASFEDLMPFDKIEVFDEKGVKRGEHLAQSDIWGGDVYEYP